MAAARIATDELMANRATRLEVVEFLVSGHNGLSIFGY
jgi:hypothetical protein